MTRDAVKTILPGAHSHLPALYGNRYPGRKQLEPGFRRPLRRALDLIAFGIKPLVEIALAMGQRHRNQRNSEIRRRAEHVTGEDSQPAAICRYARIEGHVH